MRIMQGHPCTSCSGESGVIGERESEKRVIGKWLK